MDVSTVGDTYKEYMSPVRKVFVHGDTYKEYMSPCLPDVTALAPLFFCPSP